MSAERRGLLRVVLVVFLGGVRLFGYVDHRRLGLGLERGHIADLLAALEDFVDECVPEVVKCFEFFYFAPAIEVFPTYGFVFDVVVSGEPWVGQCTRGGRSSFWVETGELLQEVLCYGQTEVYEHEERHHEA